MIIVPEKPDAETIKVQVTKVLDGDGFKAKIISSEVTGSPNDCSETQFIARLGFIDAPEIGQPGGLEAKEFLASLISGRWLELVILTKMNTNTIVDRHRRVVCVPYLTQATSTAGAPQPITRNIELEMVLNGWAWVLERYGPDERYLDALHEAKRHKRGIWARENNVHPWDYKKWAYRQRTLRIPKSHCPMDGCSGHLVERTGKFGMFLGCSSFPKCRYSRSVEC